MDTKPLMVSSAPIDLTATEVDGGLELEEDVTYSVQNVTARTVYIGQYEDEPDMDSELNYGHFIPEGETWYATPTGTSIWVWTAGNQTSYIVVTEAP